MTLLNTSELEMLGNIFLALSIIAGAITFVIVNANYLPEKKENKKGKLND